MKIQLMLALLLSLVCGSIATQSFAAPSGAEQEEIKKVQSKLSQNTALIQAKQAEINAEKASIKAKIVQCNILGYKYGKYLGTTKGISIGFELDSARADLKAKQAELNATQEELKALTAENTALNEELNALQK